MFLKAATAAKSFTTAPRFHSKATGKRSVAVATDVPRLPHPGTIIDSEFASRAAASRFPTATRFNSKAKGRRLCGAPWKIEHPIHITPQALHIRRHLARAGSRTCETPLGFAIDRPVPRCPPRRTTPGCRSETPTAYKLRPTAAQRRHRVARVRKASLFKLSAVAVWAIGRLFGRLSIGCGQPLGGVDHGIRPNLSAIHRSESGKRDVSRHVGERAVSGAVGSVICG